MPGAREMEHRVAVLVVSPSDAAVGRWTQWLEDAGFVVATCPGPRATRTCPRLVGRRCPLREIVEVALVEVPGSEREPWPEESCTRIPDDGATVLIHDGGVPTAGRGRFRLRRPATRPALVGVARQALLARGRRAASPENHVPRTGSGSAPSIV